jgi:folate-binding protein YgfZ
MLVWNVGDALLLEVPRAALGAVATALEKFIIADDASVGEAAVRAVRFDLVGAGARNALAALGLPPPEPGHHMEVELAGAMVRLLHHDLGERARFVFRVPEEAVEAFRAAIDASGCVRACSAGAWEIARIEEAEPAHGAELSEDVLFNEAGLVDHVSFQKGCYPGQEPVLMAKHRGRPPRRLCVFTIDARDVPPSGTELLADGKAVGRITSAARGVVRPGIRALGYVQSAAAEEGASFAVPQGGTAVVERIRRL